MVDACSSGISVDRAMALLDLKEKKDWDEFACKESIVGDSNGGIDSKETQVRSALLISELLDVANEFCCSKRDLQSRRLSTRVRGDMRVIFK